MEFKIQLQNICEQLSSITKVVCFLHKIIFVEFGFFRASKLISLKGISLSLTEFKDFQHYNINETV